MVLTLLPLVPAVLAWELRGADDMRTGRTVVASEVFALHTPAWSTATIVTDPAALASVTAETLVYLKAMAATDPASDAGLFAEIGITPQQFVATLELVHMTATEHPERLSDPAWLTSHFEVYRWSPPSSDPRIATFKLAPGEIRITRYLTTQMNGMPVPNAGYLQALYADPGLPWRTDYTRAQVMEGAYEAGPAAGRARPLVWLTEANVHEAIMQGSVEVRLPDATTHTYGVDVSNGIAYVRSHSGRTQDRYWYFKELASGPKGWGPPGSPEIHLKAGVSVAGDVYDLGLGAMIVLEHPDAQGGTTLRLAVLADSGGAFQPNLCQLDWYGGAFATHAALYAAWSGLPEHVRASVLIAKP